MRRRGFRWFDIVNDEPEYQIQRAERSSTGASIQLTEVDYIAERMDTDQQRTQRISCDGRCGWNPFIALYFGSVKCCQVNENEKTLSVKTIFRITITYCAALTMAVG